MDVYIDKKEKVWIVNINAFGDEMNTALYSMEELQEMMKGNEEVAFRVVEEESATLPSEQLFFQLPVDMHHLSTDESISSFIRNMKLQSEKEEEEE